MKKTFRICRYRESDAAMKRCLVGIVVLGVALPVAAQWLNYPTAGVPRLPNGQPNLAAPAPRGPDGKLDLTGVWQRNLVDFRKYHGDLSANLKEAPFQPSAEALYKRRLETFGSDDPEARCLPKGVPRIHAGAEPYKIIQLPELFLVLQEHLNMYRQIFTDGRQLPENPSPAWMGYSVGHWERDALVVSSAGYNGKTWLDANGHPTSDALHVTERFERPNFGQLRIEITIDDSKMYTREWRVTETRDLLPDSDLLEFVCLENEKSLQHYVGK